MPSISKVSTQPKTRQRALTRLSKVAHPLEKAIISTSSNQVMKAVWLKFRNTNSSIIEVVLQANQEQNQVERRKHWVCRLKQIKARPIRKWAISSALEVAAKYQSMVKQIIQLSVVPQKTLKRNELPLDSYLRLLIPWQIVNWSTFCFQLSRIQREFQMNKI